MSKLKWLLLIFISVLLIHELQTVILSKAISKYSNFPCDINGDVTWHNITQLQIDDIHINHGKILIKTANINFKQLRLELDLVDITVPNTVLKDYKFRISISKDKLLKIHQLVINNNESLITNEIEIRASKDKKIYKLVVQNKDIAQINLPLKQLVVNIEKFSFGHLLSKIDISPFIDKDISSLELNLTSSGNDWKTLLNNITGKILLEISQGELLVNNINPELSSLFFSSHLSELECSVVNLSFDHGKSNFNRTIALQTKHANLSGSGMIDISENKLEVLLHSKAKQKITFNNDIVSLLKIHGKLTNPKIAIDPAKLLSRSGSIGAAIATSGISSIAELLIEKFTEDKHPCLTAKKN